MKTFEVRVYNIEWDSSVENCNWYCDECDSSLDEQPGFDYNCGSFVCVNCGHVNYIDQDNIVDIHPYEVEETFLAEDDSDLEYMIEYRLSTKYDRDVVSFDYDIISEYEF